jgi:hypothetical protein
MIWILYLWIAGVHPASVSDVGTRYPDYGSCQMAAVELQPHRADPAHTKWKCEPAP